MRGSDYLKSLKKWDGAGGFRLDAVRAVLSKLGNPQEEYPCIHVAGTNGKGSTSVACASILAASGATVGLNISPHLHSWTERIVIDGIQITEDVYGFLGDEIYRASKEVDQTLSFHEALTVAAFLWFKISKVHFAVVEVGLGGRLDASNVIQRPLVSIITSISYDHQNILGATLVDIAKEKAGIIKNDRPVVIGALHPLALDQTLLIARELNSTCYVLNKDFFYREISPSKVNLKLFTGEIEFKPPLKGEHQLSNLALAAKAGELAGLSCTEIKNGLEDLFWPGRLESTKVLGKDLLLDCAHNLEGIEVLTKYLTDNSINSLSIGFGVLDTKDWHAMIDKLIPFSKEWYLFEPNFDRAVPTQELATYLSCFDVRVSEFGKDYSQIYNIINKLNSNELILLTGSIYFVGEIRSSLNLAERPLWTKADDTTFKRETSSAH